MFFFHDTPTTDIYTLSLHDALPIWNASKLAPDLRPVEDGDLEVALAERLILRHGQRAHTEPECLAKRLRSEEHTSELQSHSDLVCRLLLEKKNKSTT